MKIYFLAVPEAMVSTIAGPIDVLKSAVRIAKLSGNFDNNSHIKTAVVAEEAGVVECCNGQIIKSDGSYRDHTGADIVIIPSLGHIKNDLRERHKNLIAWIKDEHRNGALICSICTGAFILAESNLLNGQTATTHWAFADTFNEKFPKVNLQPDRCLIDNGDLLTAGAGSSWNDVIMRLIEKAYDQKTALQAAKFFLLENHTSGQSPLLDRKGIKTSDATIVSAKGWLNDHITESDLINRCAEHVGLSPRNFKHRFKQQTGLSPLNYVQKVRIENAKEALEMTQKSIENIAFSTGYNDLSFFRRVFKREAGITPQEYRKKFKLPMR